MQGGRCPGVLPRQVGRLPVRAVGVSPKRGDAEDAVGGLGLVGISMPWGVIVPGIDSASSRGRNATAGGRPRPFGAASPVAGRRRDG